jgi:vancomycin resistance protein YoaR
LSLKEKGIVTLMSSFSTSFDPKNTDRVHNIKLAATLLDNYFLAPGEVLSLNAFFGDTTAEKGYREAPIIVGNRLVPGFGGGLCQISSTLYNAALLANLEVIERHHHQLTVPYIDPGRDATIAYNMRDLKLRNNKEHYILISPRVEDDTLTFSFFGGQMKERVEINTKILATFESPTEYQTNPELPPGKKEIIEGVPGYRVEVWKLVYEGKELKSKEKISDDNYLPYPTVIQQGP